MPPLLRGSGRNPAGDCRRRSADSRVFRRILEWVRRSAARDVNPGKCLAILSCLLEVVGAGGSGCNRSGRGLGDDSPGHKPIAPQIEVVDDHIQGLDPMVVAFLERSELFLRNFTKIEPSYIEDLDDSRARAKQSLMEIGEKKELAGNFAPVRITLDEYENVLREIKNLDSSEELADLQTRILASGLIANMKAYQPQVMLLSQR